MITSPNSFLLFWEVGETLGSITFLKFNSHHQYKLITGHRKDEALLCDYKRLDSIVDQILINFDLVFIISLNPKPKLWYKL